MNPNDGPEAHQARGDVLNETNKQGQSKEKKPGFVFETLVPPNSLTRTVPQTSLEDQSEFFTPEEEKSEFFPLDTKPNNGSKSENEPMTNFTNMDSLVSSVAQISLRSQTNNGEQTHEENLLDMVNGCPTCYHSQGLPPSYVGQLSPMLMLRAEQEVNEKESWRIRDIQALRDIILAEPSLNSRLDDPFLLRFLRARRFDYDMAFQLLCEFYRLPRTNPELFPSVEKLTSLFDANIMARAEGRSVMDEAVFLLRLGNWNPRKVTFDEILAATIMSMESMIVDDDVTQINGIVSVIDMTGFGWSQLRKFGPSLAKKCIYIMEKCLPIRIKTIFVINESTLADIGFAIMKPFMSEELHEKIQFCGTNLWQNVHRHIPPRVLPVEFGGTRPAMTSIALQEELRRFEAIKARDSGFGFVMRPNSSGATPLATTSSSRCTPTCGGGRYSSIDDPLAGGLPGTNLPSGPLGSNGGTDMKSLFRKSQTCNGYLFDYYSNTTGID